MSERKRKFIWIALMAVPLTIVSLSAVLKISGMSEMVQELKQAGFNHSITLLGILELSSVILFVMPRTYKIGFLLLSGYLGGAMATEIAGGKFPVAAVLLTLIWISVFIRNRKMFINLPG